MKKRKINIETFGFLVFILFLVLFIRNRNVGSSKVVKDETGPPDEDTTIWMTDVSTFDSDFEKKFNKRLKELGCEYKVDFRAVPTEEYWHYADTGDLPDYSEADIVTLIAEYDHTSYYSDLAREGKICDLTNDLTEGIGKELYDSMPEEIWQGMRVDGGIYGLLNPNFRLNCYIALNQKYLKKYSLDVSEGFTMEDLVQMVQMIYSEENSKEDPKENSRGLLTAVSQDYLPGIYLPGNPYPKIGICRREGQWTADLLIDLEEYQEHLRALNQLYQDGILITDQEAGSDILAWIEESYSEEDALNRVKGYAAGDWTVIACPEWDKPFQASGWRTVLMEDSGKKEAAREVLFLAYTDRELSEMLAYGTGFKEKSDRIQTDIDRSTLYGNRFLIRPKVSDPADYQERIWDIFRNSEMKEWLGFWPDMREIQKEWKAVIKVQREHERYYYGLSDDMEAEEAVIRAELKEAGIDVVLEELNRQIKEFQQGE